MREDATVRTERYTRSTAYQWPYHSGDGNRVSPSVWLMLTSGHTSQDLSVIVETANGRGPAALEMSR